ncbi:MAG: non-canonical purine NTP pyrophosphatase [Spirochaetales bacterium]|nr:non-canonical purine NTP pyrophosphatase [Spirochaetales bacterium]
MKIVIASGNMHKKNEFAAIFQEHTLLLPADLGINFHHEETSDTYVGNALGKAQTLYRMMREAGMEALPVISDDSGISVPALGGEPGVYSARYGQEETGRDLRDDERNLFLLDKMKNIRERAAFFVCAMVFLTGEYRFFTAQETWTGQLAESPSGSKGFGYDPLLYLPDKGCTAAQLDPAEKNRISHRAKAALALKILMERL